MDRIRACRICLALNVTMFPLEGILENTFNVLVGENRVISSHFPHHVCYECAELLRKFSKFRKKCLLAQTMLCNILRLNCTITLYDIESIDRTKMKLDSNLTVTSMLTDDLLPDDSLPDLSLPDHSLPDHSLPDQMLSDHLLPDYLFPVPEIKQVNIGMVKNAELNMNMIDYVKCELEEISNVSVESNSSPSKLVSGKSCQKSKDQKPVNNKKQKKPRQTVKKPRLKATKLEAKPEIRINEKPVNEDGLTSDEVALSEDFLIEKLTMEEQVAEILKRKETSNYKDSPYKCEKCFKGFLQEATFRNHAVRHDASSGAFECSVCQQRFSLARKFRSHCARHAKRYVCRGCPFITVHMDQVKKHKEWHNGVTYKCQYCDEVSTKITSHLSHIRTKHPSEHVCELCGYSFVSGLGLKLHRSKAHRDMPLEKKEKRRKGKKEQEKKEEPKEDGSNMEQESSLYCAACGIRFATEDAKKRHLVNSTKHQSDLSNGCRDCGESFPSAQGLRAHQLLHARERLARRRRLPASRRAGAALYPAKCEHCDEMLPNRSRHWKHYQQSHQDKKYPLSENKYICEICGKGFRGRTYLAAHARLHSQERPFACAQCGRAFRTRWGLRAHAARHSDARPHACARCGKPYKTKLGLYQHYKTHTRAVPSPCQYCGKVFKSAAYRAQHVRLLHMRKPVPEQHET